MIMVNLLSFDLCEHSGVLYVFMILKLFIKVCKIVAPIILIITIIMSLTKAVGNPDELKKVFSSAVKKFIAALLIFFVPTIVNYAMDSLANRDPDSFATCSTNANIDYIKKLKEKEEAERKNRLEMREKEAEEAAKKANQKLEEDNASTNGNQVYKDRRKQRQQMSGGEGAGAANSISSKTNYGDLTLNVEKAVDTNINNPSSGLGDGRNLYRAVQNAAYTGNYVVYAQNKNYGSIDSSSKGGRICWSNLTTGEQVKCIEIGAEGGHMDGLTYDNDRGYVLKVANGRLLQIDNKKMEVAGYANITNTSGAITYVPKIHSVVQYSGGSLHFYKYNSGNNTYEKYNSVSLQNWDGEAVQGIGTDGTNIFIADSSPYSSKRNLYTYSLEGARLEKHNFGSGFGSLSSEVESAFADNDGVLYLACPQGIARVTNYQANKIGLPTR